MKGLVGAACWWGAWGPGPRGPPLNPALLRCAFASPNPSAVVANSCTHRRRRRDETRQFRLVGVGGVYWALVANSRQKIARFSARHVTWFGPITSTYFAFVAQPGADMNYRALYVCCLSYGSNFQLVLMKLCTLLWGPKSSKCPRP